MKKKYKLKKIFVVLIIIFSFFGGLYFSLNGKITVSIYYLKDIIYD